MKNRNYVLEMLSLFIICGCSKSDNQHIPPPEIAYAEDLVAIFSIPGKSASLQINWHGEKGFFGLEKGYKGVSIAPKTGIIFWDQTLPLGSRSLTILAFNNAGKISATLQLDNVLAGKFQGSFDRGVLDDNSIPLDLIFNADGTSTLISYGFTTRELQGTWAAKYGNEWSGEYLYDTASYYRIEGKIISSENGFHLEGKLINGNGVIEETSIFRVNLIEAP